MQICIMDVERRFIDMEETNLGKSSRVLYLYTRLLHGQILKKERLADQFGVNEKSIQRDLETVRDFLDRERMENGYGSQLIYDFREKGYRLDRDEKLNPYPPLCFLFYGIISVIPPCGTLEPSGNAVFRHPLYINPPPALYIHPHLLPL